MGHAAVARGFSVAPLAFVFGAVCPELDSDAVALVGALAPLALVEAALFDIDEVVDVAPFDVVGGEEFGLCEGERLRNVDVF